MEQAVDIRISSTIYAIIASTMTPDALAKSSIVKRDPNYQLSSASFFHSSIIEVCLASNFLAF
jgi:hypothetical protein